MNEEREMVLRMLKEGKISVEEADALLQALAEESETPALAAAPGAGADGPGVDIRVELGDLVRELTESIPKEVIHLERLKDLGEFRRHFKFGWRGIVSALQGLGEGQAEESSELPMVSGERLELRHAWGDIRLSRSQDDRLRMKARKRVWAATAADATREAGALSVQPRREGSTVYLGVRRVEGRVRVDMDVLVPDGVAVVLDVAKGDVRVEGLHGRVEAHVARGDVQVMDHAAPLTLVIASGDVTLRRIDGDVQLDVKSGDIVAGVVRGKVSGRVLNGDVDATECGGVTLDIVNGDVSLRQVAGDVDIEVKNGDIEVESVQGRSIRARALSGDVQVTVPVLPDGGAINGETMSGDVEIRLPSDARATIDAATMSGEINCMLPLQDRAADRGTLRRRTLRGVLNGPGAVITLRTASGDIEIRDLGR